MHWLSSTCAIQIDSTQLVGQNQSLNARVSVYSKLDEGEPKRIAASRVYAESHNDVARFILMSVGDIEGMPDAEDITSGITMLAGDIKDRLVAELKEKKKAPDDIDIDENMDGAEPFEAELQVTKNGQAKENYNNIVTILEKHSYWKKKLRYDTFKNTVIVEGQELDDALTGKVIQWFGKKNTYSFGGNAVQPFTRAIHDAAKKYSFDSLSEWILSLPKWDGISRLRTWMIEFCGSPETELTEWISEVSIMQMIARGMRPGCKARLVPIWEGPQDKGKTSAIMALGDPWAITFSISMDNKEAHMAIQGAWVAELDELDTMRKTTETRLKSFISQVQDSFVPKYLNFRVTYPRRTVFFGSTNDEKYLRDETGATRFLPIKTTDFDVDGIIAIREQLFAEARDILLTTPDIKWWEEPESIRSELNEEREKRRIQNIYVGDICKWLDGEQGADSIYRNKVTWREIAVEYLKVESPERWNSTPLQMSIYRAMRESGWYNKHTNTGNVWMRESESDASSADEVPF